MEDWVKDIKQISDKLKTEAIETIKQIDIDNLTTQSFKLLGASMGVLAFQNNLCDKLHIENENTLKIEPSAKSEENKDYLTDELKGAMEYYEMYKKTGNSGFLNLADDELEHFLFLYDLEKEKVRTQEDKQKLVDLMKWYEMILSKLKEV